MSSDLLTRNNAVVSSSQRSYPSHEGVGQGMFPVVGIILSVHPSDAKGNWTAENHPQLRGSRHECTVLAGRLLGMPDQILKNVVIPPQRHSGMDNFEEDLPRGCKAYLDGSTYKADFSDVDITKLDGEWCVVSFLDGNSQYPYLSNWWPHPYNNIDPATSGETPIEGTKANLVQADLEKKNRTRKLHRVNGVLTLVSRQGSVYLDTTEAGRTIKVEGTKRVASQVDKGGHIQVDVKKKAQLEINWNEKKSTGPQLGAGSTTSKPVHDPDLPHDDQPFSETAAQARDTERTFIRGKEYELLLKTSGLNVWCETQSSNKGVFGVHGDSEIILTQGDQAASEKLARVQIKGGNATVQANDGTVVSVSGDQVAMATKSGGQISVIGGQISISGPTGVTCSVPATFGPAAIDGIMLGTSYVASQKALFVAWDALLNGLKVYTAGIAAIVDPPPSPLTKALEKLIDALVQAKAAHELLQTKYVSAQVKSQ